jgi:hypothetical protein
MSVSSPSLSRAIRRLRRRSAAALTSAAAQRDDSRAESGNCDWPRRPVHGLLRALTLGAARLTAGARLHIRQHRRLTCQMLDSMSAAHDSMTAVSDSLTAGLCQLRPDTHSSNVVWDSVADLPDLSNSLIAPMNDALDER